MANKASTIDALKAKTTDELIKLAGDRYASLQKTAQVYFADEMYVLKNARIERTRREVAISMLTDPNMTRKGFSNILKTELSAVERGQIPHDYETVGRYLKALDMLRDIDSSGYLSRREKYRDESHEEARRILHEMEPDEQTDMNRVIALADELMNKRYAYTVKYAGR